MAKDMLDGIEAVLFDLDGTLVDSLWVWHEIDIEYLGRFGLTLPAGLQEDIGGMSFTETALYVKERFQIPDCVEKIKEEVHSSGSPKKGRFRLSCAVQGKRDPPGNRYQQFPGACGKYSENPRP